jgi:hypothetical protein
MFKRTAVPPVGASEHHARQPLNMALDFCRENRVRLVVVAASILTAYYSQLFASCVSEGACYEVKGNLTSCTEISREGSEFLSVELRNPVARNVACPKKPIREASGMEIAQKIAHLNKFRKFFFVISDGARCDVLGPIVTARVQATCCDTTPATGACALNGPLLVFPAQKSN